VEDVEPDRSSPAPGPPAAGAVRIALLDGLPIGGHALLRDRLVIDDPEGWDAAIPAARRVHGTGIASVVVHGDLNDSGPPLPTPVYVRPILSPDAPYERVGLFANTVFSCGHVALDDDRIRMYYGAADSVTAAADLSVKGILASLDGC